VCLTEPESFHPSTQLSLTPGGARIVARCGPPRFAANSFRCSEREHRIERVDTQRNQEHCLRSLEGRWGVRLVQAGGNAHQQTGETSGRRWGCRDVGGHGVDFAPRSFNLTASKQNLHRSQGWGFRRQTRRRKTTLHQHQHRVQQPPHRRK